MFNNLYANAYNPQASIDRINTQIAELERIKSQIPQTPMQPTSLTQNFQLAPTGASAIRYAESIEDVQKDFVLGDTPYFSKDLSVLWIKNAKGEIKTYTLAEIIEKDEKDLQIEFLQAQLNELKGMINNESSDTDVDESSESQESTDVSTSRKPKKK